MTNENISTRSIDLHVEMENTLIEFEKATPEKRYDLGARARLITTFAQRIGGMSVD